ncbi:hypothetical protein [Nitrosopumilus sp.]|uniref:hypothetical protein n=1 Tax=Nitrosopumilus sp. TaxID=2024843 RepID=UPI003D1511C7
MPGIDRFLSESIETAIKKDLDQETEYLMKKTMFQKYGISIRQSVEDVEKLHQIRKELLDEVDYSQLKKYLNKICTFKKSDDGKFYIVTVSDNSLKRKFMETLGDDESRKILTSMTDKSCSTSDVLRLQKISTTSGYRKVNALIRDGFLIQTKRKMIENRRPVDQYTTFYHKIFFEIKRNDVLLDILIKKKMFESSSLFDIV